MPAYACFSWILRCGEMAWEYGCWQTARHGSYGMDMLVVVGTSVSYLYSTVSLFLACVWASRRGDGSHREMEHPHLFLESPAMLLTFITLG